jgi:dipeptidyl aminopeptidase/acylaminoacyl peptidase
MRATLVTFLSLLFLVGCDQPSQPPEEKVQAVEAPQPPALISRSELFGNPVKFQGRISPDGKWLSWLAPHEGVMNIWVAPADDPDAAKPVTFDTGRGIPIHFWSYTNTHVFFTQDKDGDENDHVYSVDIATGETTDLTPVEDGIRARIEGVSKNKPDSLLIGINDRNPQLFDLYEMTISSGETKLVAENPGYIQWLADNNLTPRLAIRPQPAGGLDVVDIETGNALFTIQAEDALNSYPVGFNKDNTQLFALSSENRDTAALVSIDLATGETEVLAQNSDADISDVVVDPVTDEVLAYAVNHTTTVWYGINETVQKEMDVIDQAIPGEKQFLAATADGNTVVIYSDLPEKPGVYYLFDRTRAAATELFETQPSLNDDTLATMLPVEIPSRDGLTLVSYLTLPADAERDANGLPTKSYPMVLNVHGGPWARDSFGFNATHQWLANRGYAVLSVNYRGSTGFGKAFTNAAVREFAGKMHDDLIDGVNWAIKNGVTSKDQVAIMGGSYGGYATLVGLTFTPDTFACGVDIVGPSSLVTLIESFPAYWGPSLQFTWYKYVGDPANETERADMFNRSPISRVGDIQVPLLIGQGENDPRVTKLESDQLVASMDEKELPVTYLNFPDEGHGFARPENRMAFFSTTEAFLSTCLGGRYEPIGSDFDGSSVQVLHGADYVPGLAEAMKLQASE